MFLSSVSNGENCIVVDKDPEAFQDAIESLLEDPDRLSRIGQNAQETIRGYYAYGTEIGPEKWFYRLLDRVATQQEVKPFDYQDRTWEAI